MLVVLLVTQLSVVLAPSTIVIGVALNEPIVGFGGAVTITFAVAVTVPALFVAFSV